MNNFKERSSPNGLPATVASDRRFPDGGAFRIEIPSVEGPGPLTAVLEEAARFGVTIRSDLTEAGV